MQSSHVPERGQIWWSASHLFHRSAMWKGLQSKNLALFTFTSPATRKIFGSQFSAEKTYAQWIGNMVDSGQSSRSGIVSDQALWFAPNSHLCHAPPPPKAELYPTIWSRAGGEDTRETALVSPLPSGDGTATYSSNKHMPFKKEHSRTSKRTGLWRQLNPDQAPL